MRAVEFAVSGHVNRAIIVVDQDGLPADGDLQHVDANSSQSRVRFTGSGDLDNGATVGINMELAVLSGQTGGNDNDTNTRHLAVNVAGDFGKLTLGHTSEAADGMAHARLGGASWLGGVTNWCAYYSGTPTNTTACPTNDGGRMEILRYDTPALGPATLAFSTADNERWSTMLKAAGSAGDMGYDFRVGYIGEFDTDGGTKAGDVLTTSAAVSFGQGTSIAAAWSRDDVPQSATTEHEYLYAEIDQSYGDGSVGVYWKQGERGNVEGTLWGVGLGHGIGGGATVYAGFRHMEQDNQEDANLYLTGMRVTFN